MWFIQINFLPAMREIILRNSDGSSAEQTGTYMGRSESITIELLLPDKMTVWRTRCTFVAHFKGPWCKSACSVWIGYYWSTPAWAPWKEHNLPTCKSGVIDRAAFNWSWPVDIVTCQYHVLFVIWNIHRAGKGGLGPKLGSKPDWRWVGLCESGPYYEMGYQWGPRM